jgi:hypothetical protein
MATNKKALPAPEPASSHQNAHEPKGDPPKTELPDKNEVQCGICFESIKIQGVIPCCEHSCMFPLIPLFFD